MTRMICKAYWLLICAEFLLGRDDFAAIHALVRKRAVRSLRPDARLALTAFVSAVTLACVFYPKRVLCLQRSAVTTMLLRSGGWPAEMVIGVQSLPFQAHAWVELHGTVVGDKSYVPEIYQELERC